MRKKYRRCKQEKVAWHLISICGLKDQRKSMWMTRTLIEEREGEQEINTELRKMSKNFTRETEELVMMKEDLEGL